jgi:hypothetical protein
MLIELNHDQRKAPVGLAGWLVNNVNHFISRQGQGRGKERPFATSNLLLLVISVTNLLGSIVLAHS